MAATVVSGLQIAIAKPCFPSSQRLVHSGAAVLNGKSKPGSWSKLASAHYVASVQSFQRNFTSSSIKFDKITTKAMSQASEIKYTLIHALFPTRFNDIVLKLPDGSLIEITKVYPLDGVFDNLDDVPEDEVAESVKKDFGSIDILVHSLANGPEVIKPLLETSRKGYLAALSASSYSYVSLLKHFVPIMNPDMEEV
ncbi:enoyl-[acyl-carrier-protein] reductase [NADH], chloroplastic-like [Quillaja saponaria]|uniref:Enoyl-[acyl-carrier-protein] reductase [NADH], chloroplastic-like n=1 Tax=Quillaja saponaria TaxID=32244 RepID=A0AAD7QCR0_QUISA|nr:enoyl-[acyl-carrier-protein] reductase [NADH], chloroplastic-like [Quillaja saponaria]